MIYRAEHKNKYTVVDNGVIHDLRISVKARYLLMLMLSLPDDWKFSINGLSSIMGEGVVSVRSGLNELSFAGYLKITKRRGTDGRFEYTYDIREIPIKDDEPDTEPEQKPVKSVKKAGTQAKKAEKTGDPKTDKPQTQELKTAITEYVNMRRKMGKPLGKAGYNRLMSRLRRWADTEYEQAEIVNKSIERGWVDIYKPDKPEPSSYQYDRFAPESNSEQQLHDIEQLFMMRQYSMV